jgi:hypothetical protein
MTQWNSGQVIPLILEGISGTRVCRIYRKLELNLRIKLRKWLKREEKPEELAVPAEPNVTWSLEFMADRLEGCQGLSVAECTGRFQP